MYTREITFKENDALPKRVINRWTWCDICHGAPLSDHPDKDTDDKKQDYTYTINVPRYVHVIECSPEAHDAFYIKKYGVKR